VIVHTREEYLLAMKKAVKGDTIEFHEGYVNGCWKCYHREMIKKVTNEKATTVTEIQCCMCGNILKLYAVKDKSAGCGGNFRFLRSYILKEEGD